MKGGEWRVEREGGREGEREATEGGETLYLGHSHSPPGCCALTRDGFH